MTSEIGPTGRPVRDVSARQRAAIEWLAAGDTPDQVPGC